MALTRVHAYPSFSARSEKAMMSLSKSFQLRVYFHDIYREQSDKIDIVVWLSTFGMIATDFQHQAFSSLDKHDNHAATTFEAREKVITKYAVRISKLVNQKQAYLVTETLTHLTERLHSSNLYSLKSLTTVFVKILHHQTFTLYGMCL